MLKIDRLVNNKVEMRTDLPDYRMYPIIFADPHDYRILASYDGGRIREIYFYIPLPHTLFSFRTADHSDISYYQHVDDNTLIRLREGVEDRRYHINRQNDTIESEGRRYYTVELESDLLFPSIQKIEEDVYRSLQEFMQGRPDIELPLVIRERMR